MINHDYMWPINGANGAARVESASRANNGRKMAKAKSLWKPWDATAVATFPFHFFFLRNKNHLGVSPPHKPPQCEPARHRGSAVVVAGLVLIGLCSSPGTTPDVPSSQTLRTTFNKTPTFFGIFRLNKFRNKSMGNLQRGKAKGSTQKAQRLLPF